MKTAPVEFAIPTRYSLLSRLQNREDQESWKDFFETYWSGIDNSSCFIGIEKRKN